MPVPDQRIRTPRVKHLDAEITRLTRLSDDTLALGVTALPAQQPLHAQAGQFCTLKVPGVPRPRPYSLARAPSAERDGEYSFLVRLIPGGELSGWLSDGEPLGARVELGGPLGRFGLDESRGPMVCVAGGSGMSAMFALIEEAALTRTPRDCHFYYGARTRRDLYLNEEIAALQSKWHRDYQFTFTQVLSEEPAGSEWRGARGWVGEAAVHGLRDIDWNAASVFLCGPPAMIDAATPAVIKAGADPVRCYFDRFDDAQTPAPSIDNRRCVLCDECLLVKPLANCIVETSGLDLNAAGVAVAFEPLAATRTSGLYYNALVVDPDECIRCGACIEACPHGAIQRGDAAPVVTLRQC